MLPGQAHWGPPSHIPFPLHGTHPKLHCRCLRHHARNIGSRDAPSTGISAHYDDVLCLLPLLLNFCYTCAPRCFQGHTGSTTYIRARCHANAYHMKTFLAHDSALYHPAAMLCSMHTSHSPLEGINATYLSRFCCATAMLSALALITTPCPVQTFLPPASLRSCPAATMLYYLYTSTSVDHHNG